MFHLLLALIYICFISLGLPDSLLGSAWPILHKDIAVPMSYAGIVSMTITVGTVISSFLSDRLVRALGTGKITALSIAMTAVALFGFSISNSFWMLIFWAVPYGLGAGAVDAVLNNYVALHYKPQHMSWLHCFWGLGAAVSPYIMSFALFKLESWSRGYLIVFVIQAVLSAVVFASLPLWKQCLKVETGTQEEVLKASPKFKDIISINGAIPCLIAFFAYCGFELTASLWASSYLVQDRGISVETASALASLFYVGITIGRGINGFLAMKFGDRFLIRMGIGIVSLGVLLLFLPFNSVFAMVGYIVIGFGCAPIYPCIIHMTPSIFGRELSQALIGIQMAFAYIGFCLIPPLFGFIAERITISLLPPYLLVLLCVVTIMHEILVAKTKNKE